MKKTVNNIVLICICLIPLYGQRTIKIKMNSGRYYNPAQVARITNDSIEVWINTSTIVLAQSNISQISIDKPSVTLFGTCIGTLAGFAVGARVADSLEGLDRIFGPFTITLYGLFGNGIGSLLGFIASRDKVYYFSKMTDENQKSLIEKLHKNYGISHSG